MANPYIGVDGVARQVSQPYVGVASVARRVDKGYVGVNGVAREFYVCGSNWNYYKIIETVTSYTWSNDGVEYLTIWPDEIFYPCTATPTFSTTTGWTAPILTTAMTAEKCRDSGYSFVCRTLSDLPDTYYGLLTYLNPGDGKGYRFSGAKAITTRTANISVSEAYVGTILVPDGEIPGTSLGMSYVEMSGSDYIMTDGVNKYRFKLA